jgi:hypothetical protein
MSILDDAIREHLELKRAHGADEAEVKRLEDEAFGPPERPGEDPFAEAPTQFMTAETIEADAGGEDAGGRRINIADLQEPPPPEQAAAAPAEQPTEFFDVEAAMGEEAPATEAPSPSDEEIVEAELSEPKLAPVEPATEIHASRTEAPAEAPAEEDEEDEEFWSEQRLSDELDQALESPLAEEHELPPPAAEPEQDTGEQDDARPQVDYDPDTGHEDVLEDTPEFLEESPEDDELWFEQKPPKDFDFDD